jgi:hypothetical protein
MLGGAIMVWPVVPQDIRINAVDAPPPAIHNRFRRKLRIQQLKAAGRVSFQMVFIGVWFLRGEK